MLPSSSTNTSASRWCTCSGGAEPTGATTSRRPSACADSPARSLKVNRLPIDQTTVPPPAGVNTGVWLVALSLVIDVTTSRDPAGRRRRAGDDPQLLHLGKTVGHAPVLDDPAVLKAADIHDGDVEGAAARTAERLASMGAACSEPGPHLVAASRRDVLDGHLDVGRETVQEGDPVLDAFPGRRLDTFLVLDMVFGHDLVHHREVAAAESLGDKAPKGVDVGLLLPPCRCHGCRHRIASLVIVLLYRICRHYTGSRAACQAGAPAVPLRASSPAGGSHPRGHPRRSSTALPRTRLRGHHHRGHRPSGRRGRHHRLLDLR